MKKGYIVNWDVQRTVWEHVIRDKLKMDPTEYTAVITEPQFDPIANQRALDEVFFEDYGFSAIYRSNTTSIVADRFQGRPASTYSSKKVILRDFQIFRLRCRRVRSQFYSHCAVLGGEEAQECDYKT